MAVLGEYRERGERQRAMLVGGEAKMGQAQTRARRRAEDSADARRREAVVVAESNSVSATAAILRGMTSAPILVDDEDDDVVVSSPRSYNQAIFKARVESHRSTQQATLPVEVDPSTELRLGPVGEHGLWTQQPRQGRRGRPARAHIDLTDLPTPSRPDPVNDDCVILHEYTKSKKRKCPAQVEPSVTMEIPPITPAPEAEPYKLNCAICMDIMKEETSTICGHIFCQKCIYGAITSQKKCPTCRKKLTMKNTHRIYL